MFCQLDKLFPLMLIYFYLCYCCQLEFHAEYGTTNGRVIPRSAASNGKTVRFENEEQFVFWNFVTHSSCNIDILNVIYTNDGQSDNITVFIDGNYVGDFQTVEHSRKGDLWNSLVPSGLIGSTTVLPKGNHTLNVSVSLVDVYGVEVDEVIVGSLCDDGQCSITIIGPPNSTLDTTLPPDYPTGLSPANIIAIVTTLITFLSVITAATGVVLGVWFKCRKK